MKENALFNLLLLLLVAICNPASAQAPSKDVVTMKDGKILTGKILQYSPGHTLRLEQSDGQIMELLDADIAKIQQGIELPTDEKRQLPTKKPASLPKAKTHGLYTASMLSFAAGNSGGEGLSLGAGFSQVFGYQLNQFLGVGAGFGIDNYSRRGETVYPLFGEVRSFLPSKKKSGNFYALAAGGYSLAFARKRLEITKAEGGPMGHLAIGYRDRTIEGLDINLDIGPKFQRASFNRTLHNGDLEERKIDFRRIFIRVGIGFWK
ncbi:MAG: hypothetical protein IPM82_14045 [Saprospiraceae bacterium]|nr:hypothetical protein [Saprospiraceae bacterium]